MNPTDKDTLRTAALNYHQFPRPGKLEIRATKPLANGRDLARAYSPGVAEACVEITKDPVTARDYTSRGNLVAVVTNGSAVLGLGNIGALASKPVMEGKAVLFKKFANIDCFDIELNEPDPEKLADIVCALEPTFGAINLEDIKAPDCFIVEKLCQERMNIPVFHDDQHGTAIVVGAAATNALRVAGKKFEDIKIVSTGGGAAGIACLNMLLKLGVKRENVWLCDIEGLVYEGREKDMTPQKADYAQGTTPATLDDVIEGADMFLGLSGPGVLKPEMAAKMSDAPIIFALANPSPEITPDEARKVACIEGIAELARKTTSAEAAAAYQGEKLTFGAEYLIPKPFDPRLIGVVAGAVAKAAMETGVATRPVPDLDAYRANLDGSVFKSALLMRPIFEAASTASRRIVYAEGEDERVLRAAQAVMEETIDKPILIGRPEVIALPRLLANISWHYGPSRRDARLGKGDNAHQYNRDRRSHGSPRGSRQLDLRHLRSVPMALELRAADFGIRDACCAPYQAFWTVAKHCAVLAFAIREPRYRLRSPHACGDGYSGQRAARFRIRGRNAHRLCARRRIARQSFPRSAPSRPCKLSCLRECRRGLWRAQHHENEKRFT